MKKTIAHRHRRQMADSIMESMAYMDPTRSHELSPLNRFKSRHQTKAILHRLAIFCGVSVVVWAAVVP